MNITGSIQARMSSTRLPGKVLKEICGKPMLLWQAQRLKRSRLLKDVIVATTVNPADDAIVALCQKHGIKFYRGSEEDVLGRIASLIKEFKIDAHVEFFGDSPLVDPQIIDEVIQVYLQHKDQYDYVSNSIKTTYPPGQEVLVYRGSALLEADQLVPKTDPLREHVNIHITRHPERFRIFNVPAPAHYHYPDIYLEVDTAEDFELISNIITYFNGKGIEDFTLVQILEYLKANEHLVKLNNHVVRRWKQFNV